MTWFSAQSRIAFGQIALLVSILLATAALGMLPNPRNYIMRNRAQLCETIALNSSVLANRNDVKRINAVLTALVRRNNEIVSAGVRRADGKLVIEVGQHAANWQRSRKESSSDTEVLVPIFAGTEKWGTVELRFTPIYASGFWGFVLHPWTQLCVFVFSASFVLYYVYLSKMLKHLDPSKAVPGRVRSALDTLAEGLLVLDCDSRIVLANQSFADMLGTAPERLMGARPAKLAWSDESGAPLDDFPWSRTLAEQVAQTDAIMQLDLGEGSIRIFKVNCTPVFGQEGECRGVLTSFEDVTELESNKVELRESKDAAEAANKAKSEFLANMSHEIRTPMNAILGFTDVLRRGIAKDESERQEYLGTIHRSGEHLMELINDVLDLSKIESGKMEMEKTNVSPHQIIGDVASVLRVRADEKSIALNVKFEEKIPEAISSDPTRLRQIVTNLVGNAIKFTDQGGVTIAARLIKTNGKDQLAIDVRDTGIGVKEDQLENIFDPFSQADSSVTRKFGGTGLGLAISRRFAEAMGGSLSATSKLGEGSVFTVTVDTGELEGIRMIDADEAVRSNETAVRPERDSQLALSSGRVLLVDDGEANRQLISLILRRAGVDVDTAENGQISVEMATANSYDLILMDMQMPVMDGYTATRTLREKGFTLPIIALTANAMKGDEEKCRAAGCSGFLTKPVSIDKLMETLSEVLGSAPPKADQDSQPFPTEADEPATESAQEDEPRALVEQERKVQARPSSAQAEVQSEQDVMFARFISVEIEAIREGVQRKDWTTVIDIAAALHGTAAAFGWSELLSAVASLESSARKGDFATVETALAELERTLDKVSREVVRNERDDRPSTSDMSMKSNGAKERKPRANSMKKCREPIVSTLPMDDLEFRKVVVDFVPHLRNQMQKMQQLAERGNLEELAKSAHWLKGAAGTVGFLEFTTPGKQLEIAAKAAESDQVGELLAELMDMVDAIEIPELTASVD